MRTFIVVVVALLELVPTWGYLSLNTRQSQRRHGRVVWSSTNDKDVVGDEGLADLLTSRLPTSVDDQVRQAVDSLRRATSDGLHRHSLRLLLPVIGATELDDWPGGARQMMQAASPLMDQILQGVSSNDGSEISLQKVMIDESDGVYAVMAQAPKAKDDSMTVLLPSAESVSMIREQIEKQVGPERNLIIVNPQWKRRADFGNTAFGGMFGGGAKESAVYVEQFTPTFSLTNLICEGESIRVLRTYPGPWRVYVREENANTGDIDWKFVGSKDFVDTKPGDWEKRPENQRDGGRLFDYGQPTYQEIAGMLQSSPNYTPKNPAERAAAAFTFIKDSL